jgi:hypothetical protein
MGIGEQGLAVLRVDPAGQSSRSRVAAGRYQPSTRGADASSPDDLIRALEQAAKQNKQHCSPSCVGMIGRCLSLRPRTPVERGAPNAANNDCVIEGREAPNEPVNHAPL